MMSLYNEQHSRYCQLVEQALAEALPNVACPQKVVEDAMRYSLLGGGKRLRAVLVLACCELGGGSVEAALPLACAIEMVHAYSLIHDDLPCMDDDDLRRGKPTCHVVYGEAIAVLAGDALLTKAFEMVSSDILTDKQISKACRIAAGAAGSRGMIGGQVIDIEHEGRAIEKPLLDKLHSLKTGALIRAAAALGCCASGCGNTVTKAVDRYAAHLGLVFQITDDILDVISTTEELGKPIGSDSANNKTTYATLYGVETSQKIVRQLADEAKTSIEMSGVDCCFLTELIDKVATRTK